MKIISFIWIGLSVVLISCHNQNTASKIVQKNIVSYKDSVFLNIDADMSDPFAVWDRELYGRAHDRFIPHVYVSGDTLAWDIKNGAEIKISENIYQFITRTMKYNNRINLPSGKYSIFREKSTGHYYVIMKHRTPYIDSLFIEMNTGQ